MKWLDLSWPEVVLLIVIMVFAIAYLEPATLDVVAGFFGRLGPLLGMLKPF